MLQINRNVTDYLAEWHSRRPVFAVMGEYSSGKSTLLNFILGQTLFHMQITATNFPPIWLTFADTPAGLAVGTDGSSHSFDPAKLNEYGGSKHAVLHLSLPIPALRDVDIIDTPGISDVRLAKKSLNNFGPYLDFVLWCSNASQAWRQTERALWEAFPPSLHKTSILTLTQIDKLRNGRDLAKVMKRVSSNAGPLFAKTLAVSVADAIDAQNCADTLVGEALNNRSNISALNEALSEAMAAAATACERRTPMAAPVRPPEQITTPDTEERKTGPIEAPSPLTEKTKENPMANTDISKLSEIGGFIGACLVDSETGLMMASEGGGKLDLEAAGAANTEVVKAKLAAIEMLGLDDAIDDILITLGKQFHLIRPLEKSPTVFVYVALDKKAANLGMARVQVKNVEKTIKL